jgi:hypothetical protein
MTTMEDSGFSRDMYFLQSGNFAMEDKHLMQREMLFSLE